MKGLPRLGELIQEARNRKEVWAWDGVVPLRDTTLLAGFMKKGKTTLLTGLVNGWLKRGSYCGRGTQGVRKVLYLAPEEGDTLVRRFERLGFGAEDEPALCVLPRGHRAWQELVSRYRMREWPQVVEEMRKEGIDAVILDGLHTLRKLFEPGTSEDNDGVEQFMVNFVIPMADMTVVAALHTKKGGGDPRVNVPPEEMIRGASAWMAHPGQILVLEHMRKEDMKRFHAFGRYEGSSADGWVVKYNERTHDYEAVGGETGEGDGVTVEAQENVAKTIQDDLQTKAVIERAVQEAGESGLGLTQLMQTKLTKRAEVTRRLVAEMVEEGRLRVEEQKARGGAKKVLFLNGADDDPDPA